MPDEKAIKKKQKDIRAEMKRLAEICADFSDSKKKLAAGLIENFEIAAAAVAKAALPHCNITFMAGPEMKTNVLAYLAVLAEANPQSVGGALPGDDFYYIDQSDAK